MHVSSNILHSKSMFLQISCTEVRWLRGLAGTDMHIEREGRESARMCVREGAEVTMTRVKHVFINITVVTMTHVKPVFSKITELTMTRVTHVFINITMVTMTHVKPVFSKITELTMTRVTRVFIDITVVT
jgi:hypothetical protein